jgi:hypothetical protein
MEPVPLVRSPLRLVWREKHLLALDVEGRSVMDGVRSSDTSNLMTIATANGTWRIQRAGQDRSSIVLDAMDREVARLERRGVSRTEIVIPDEEPIIVSSSAFSLTNSARIGRIGKARAPYFFPRRYVTVRFGDDFLSHRSRELVLACAALIAWNRIQIKIDVQASG